MNDKERICCGQGLGEMTEEDLPTPESIKKANKYVEKMMDRQEKRRIIKLAEKIKRECKHEHTQPTSYGTVECAICGKDLGWWCPDSSNNVCEYYGIHEHWPERGEFYDEDDCIYCHQPEERK